MFDELTKVKHFKELKGLKGLHLKAEAYLEQRWASMIDFLRENSSQLIIFAKRTPSLIVKGSVCKRSIWKCFTNIKPNEKRHYGIQKYDLLQNFHENTLESDHFLLGFQCYTTFIKNGFSEMFSEISHFHKIHTAGKYGPEKVPYWNTFHVVPIASFHCNTQWQLCY